MKLKVTLSNKLYKDDIPEKEVAGEIDVEKFNTVDKLGGEMQKIIMIHYKRITPELAKDEILYLYTDLELKEGETVQGGVSLSGNAIKTMATAFKAITHYAAKQVLDTINPPKREKDVKKDE